MRSPKSLALDDDARAAVVSRRGREPAVPRAARRARARRRRSTSGRVSRRRSNRCSRAASTACLPPSERCSSARRSSAASSRGPRSTRWRPTTHRGARPRSWRSSDGASYDPTTERASDDAFLFDHALIRDATYAASPSPSGRSSTNGLRAGSTSVARSTRSSATTSSRRRSISATQAASMRSLASAAAVRLGRAGTRALWSLDPRAARVLIDRAIELLPPTDPERLELECGLGEVYKALSENTVAVSILEAVVERARALGDARIELRSQVELVWPRLLDGSMSAPEASTFLDDALSRLDQAGDAVRRCESRGGVRRCSWAPSETGHDAALAALRAGATRVSGSRLAGREELAGGGRRPRSRGACPSPRRWTSAGRRSSAAELIRESIAYLQPCLAWLLALNDDVEGARHAADDARRALSEFGEDVALQTSCAVIFGSIEVLAEDWLAAETIFQDALDFCSRRSFWRAWRAQFLSLLGEVALGKSDLAAALEYAEEAKRLSPESDVHVAVQWRRVAARALAGDGHRRTGVAPGGRSRRDRRHRRRPRRPRRRQSRSRRGAASRWREGTGRAYARGRSCPSGPKGSETACVSRPPTAGEPSRCRRRRGTDVSGPRRPELSS